MSITIGVYSPFLGGSNDMGEVLLGIQDSAAQAHANVLVIPGPPTVFQGQRIAHDRVSGWIAVHATDGIAELTESGKPLVLVNCDAPGFTGPIVLPDNIGGGQAAVEHLLTHGHTRIAFTGNLNHRDVRDRFIGYQLAHEHYGVPIDPALIIDLQADDEQILRATVAEWLNNGMPCTAAFAVNDYNAHLISHLIAHAGRELSTTLALVGFDDRDRDQYLPLQLTTVRQSFRENGRIAGQLLFACMRGQPPHIPVHYVPTALIVRNSCGCNTDILPTPNQAHSFAHLADALAAILNSTDTVSIDPARDSIHAAIRQIVDSLEQALHDATPIPLNLQHAAWRTVIAQTGDLVSLHTLVDTCEAYATEQTLHDLAARTRTQAWLRQTRLVIAREHQVAQRAHADLYTHAASITYNVSLSLLTLTDPLTAHQLQWLASTSEQAGCLALWAPSSHADHALLQIVGTYSSTGPAPALGHALAPEAFPPNEVMRPTTSEPQPLIKLLPIRSTSRDWGVLALYGQAEPRMYSDTIAALLASTLEQAELIRSLTEGKEVLGLAYERERALTQDLSHAIEKLRSAQHQVIHAEKMAALGTLVAGVAHELRNPLNLINNLARLSIDLATEITVRMATPLAEHDRLAEVCSFLQRNSQEIYNNGQRADAIISTMLLHTRSDIGQHTIVDINEIVWQALILAYESIRARRPEARPITIQQDLQPDLPPIEAIPQQLNQAFINLFDNACYALWEPTSLSTGKALILRVTTALVGQQIEIRIWDNGGGIPSAIQATLFEPFVTSKPPGEGNGLGLSITHDIITNHHAGTITVLSIPEQSTEFTITLPLQQPATAGIAPMHPASDRIIP